MMLVWFNIVINKSLKVIKLKRTVQNLKKNKLLSPIENLEWSNKCSKLELPMNAPIDGLINGLMTKL